MDIFESNESSALLERLKRANKIVLTGHRSPDGDALGASLALWNHLKERGIDSTVVMPDGYPDFLKWMTGQENVVLHSESTQLAEQLLADADVLFVLDYNDSSRVGELQAALDSSNAYKVMVDHHQMPSDFVDLMFSDVKSCSTAELVYRLIESWGEADLISKETAGCLYCGIMTDSGSFRFPSVTSRTHRIAAALCDTGLNHSEIHNLVYDNNRVDKIKLVGYALTEKLEVLEDLHAAIISLSKAELSRYNYKKGDTEGLVNTALGLEGVNFAAFIHESDDRVKISFRSVGSFSVRDFSANHFNGGGHFNAAGGASYDSLEDVVSKIKTHLSSYKADLDY